MTLTCLPIHIWKTLLRANPSPTLTWDSYFNNWNRCDLCCLPLSSQFGEAMQPKWCCRLHQQSQSVHRYPKTKGCPAQKATLNICQRKTGLVSTFTWSSPQNFLRTRWEPKESSPKLPSSKSKYWLTGKRAEGKKRPGTKSTPKNPALVTYLFQVGPISYAHRAS